MTKVRSSQLKIPTFIFWILLVSETKITTTVFCLSFPCSTNPHLIFQSTPNHSTYWKQEMPPLNIINFHPYQVANPVSRYCICATLYSKNNIFIFIIYFKCSSFKSYLFIIILHFQLNCPTALMWNSYAIYTIHCVKKIKWFLYIYLLKRSKQWVDQMKWLMPKLIHQLYAYHWTLNQVFLSILVNMTLSGPLCCTAKSHSNQPNLWLHRLGEVQLFGQHGHNTRNLFFLIVSWEVGTRLELQRHLVVHPCHDLHDFQFLAEPEQHVTYGLDEPWSVCSVSPGVIAYQKYKWKLINENCDINMKPLLSVQIALWL